MSDIFMNRAPMPMSVGELLAEPQLGLHLIAGEDGLDRQITWSHTSDLPNLWEWVSDGVLLLTNGLSLPTEANEQVELVHRLAEAGAVGLAIGEQMHAPELKPEFLEACRTLPFPLLAVPYPLPFIAISRSIAEALLIEESRRIKQTARIYDILRRASAPTDAWTVLREELSAELNSTLHVIDETCLHPWIPSDPMPSEAELAGLRHARQEADTANRHFQWTELAGQAVLLMDVPTHEHAVLVVFPRSDAPHPDGVILLHSATIIGLALSQQARVGEEHRRSANSLLEQAIHGGNGTLDPADGAFGPNTLRMACFSLPDGLTTSELSERMLRHGIANAHATVDAMSYLLFDAQASDHDLAHILGELGAVGLSSALTVRQLQQALRESRWMHGKSVQRNAGTLSYVEDASWFGLSGHREGEELVARLLGPLIEHDRRNGSDLLGTLRLYLQLQRSPQKVATSTYTHRQTVIARLRKISQLTGLDLADTPVIAQIWLALKAHDALHLAADLPAAHR